MTGRTVGIIIIAVIVIAFGIWYLLTLVPGEARQTPGATGITGTGTTVAYTNDGFSPRNITVPVGTAVTFDNDSGDPMWVASAMHPTHEAYDGTALSAHCASGYAGPEPFDQCNAGGSYSFTFTKPGTWNYHNHANPADFGSVTVTP
ncbi:hypothetical protein HYV30_04155 [Candidatus Kaiserbacteria bacterium]|nr:hypothetical protein [Candidatus Kaiserbacteria bacterium]